ncbi:hypothetical protein V1478_000257 [Vespula squamosa]|uniref:Uncharacterized protein n=1 Tax=Vespula squamosa TaxID=30214 RepID=A0ABD2C506_VESSQ
MILVTYFSTKDNEITSGILMSHYLPALGLERSSIDSSLNADLQNYSNMLAGLTLNTAFFVKLSLCFVQVEFPYLRHLDMLSKETDLDFDFDTVITGEDHIHEETTPLIMGLVIIITNIPHVVTERTEIRIANRKTNMQFLEELRRLLKWHFLVANITIVFLEADFLERHKFIVDLTNRKICDVQTTNDARRNVLIFFWYLGFTHKPNTNINRAMESI